MGLAHLADQTVDSLLNTPRLVDLGGWREQTGGDICYSPPRHIVLYVGSHEIGGLLNQSRRSTIPFLFLAVLSDLHLSPGTFHTSR